MTKIYKNSLSDQKSILFKLKKQKIFLFMVSKVRSAAAGCVKIQKKTVLNEDGGQLGCPNCPGGVKGPGYVTGALSFRCKYDMGLIILLAWK